MSTIISLEGGVGRIITSIPALLKYHKNNPNKEWYVSIPAWSWVTWGIPELQQRTIDPNERGSFDLYWKAKEVIKPEPYIIPEYYRNEISIKDAFDIAINNSRDHSDLPNMRMELSFAEKRVAYDIVKKTQDMHQKSKTIVIQPYGSTACPHPSGPFDDSLRSIPFPMLSYLVDQLSLDYNLIYFGAHEFHLEKMHKPNPDPHLREWAAIINEADYFIGCDSCGQHMAQALGKPASVFIGGTHRNNTTYSNFHIIERDVPFYPDAMRVSEFQSMMSSRLNKQRIEFTFDEIKKIYEEIVNNIENKKSQENNRENMCQQINKKTYTLK